MPSDNKFSHLQNALRSRRVYTDPVTGEPLPRQVRAGDLQPHPDNPKIHPDKQHDYVAGSLDELGQYDGIIINIANQMIVDGHERAWLALGYDEDMLVDVDWVELTEDEHRKALVITDYSRSFALWDTENLERILSELEPQGDDSYLRDARVGEMLGELATEQHIQLPDDFKEYDESVANEVEYITCPHCGEKFPK